MLKKVGDVNPEQPAWPVVCSCKVSVPQGEEVVEQNPMLFLKTLPIPFPGGAKLVAGAVCTNCGTAYIADVEGPKGFVFQTPAPEVSPEAEAAAGTDQGPEAVEGQAEGPEVRDTPEITE